MLQSPDQFGLTVPDELRPHQTDVQHSTSYIPSDRLQQEGMESINQIVNDACALVLEKCRQDPDNSEQILADHAIIIQTEDGEQYVDMKAVRAVLVEERIERKHAQNATPETTDIDPTTIDMSQGHERGTTQEHAR